MKNREGGWLGRNLENYKKIQTPIARDKGVLKELQSCTTLTEARKVVYGYKKRNAK